MDSNKLAIKNRIMEILDLFGITGARAAEIMGVKASTFNCKKNDNNPRHWFNQKNLDDLVNFIKREAEKL
ncbi:hypothetical protein [Riemerella columbipharyngis]|uniref:Uncharacterized protein n=1 Tax=Riemerella columbipharyngis TaxID=1071918 RepID=A0A1G7AL64_9FLAO|nr:hypothetical protein [Riemerella columbipharyngis]SDE15674.1 hypothetical protein SAMN05421544_10422 [Riemerella columbipharyngis]